MNKQNISKKIKNFFESYDQFIKDQKTDQLFELMSSIDNIEEQFLNDYQNRKKEGMFYTDNQISNFMVKEALLCVINKKLDQIFHNIKKAKDFKEIFNYDWQSKQKIIEILLNLTICDPACGSGIFLLSCANIIYDTLLKLNHKLSSIQIKEIIIKNLNGYDINNIAIKLCTLKFLRWYDRNHNTSIKKILSIIISNLKLQNSILSSENRKFDIIIGNPPYGNILDSEEKVFLKKKNIFYNDIYCTFILKALEWSNEFISFLVPKSFLLRQGYIKFRNNFFTRANLLKVFDVGSKLFKEATNEVQIILYENKRDSSPKDLVIYEFPKKEIITYSNQNVDSLRICFNSSCPFNLNHKKLFVYTFLKKCQFCGFTTVPLNRIRIKSNEEIYSLINKIENSADINYLNPINFPKMIRGEEEKGLRLVKEKLRDNISGSCIFLSARNDFDYYYFKKTKSFNIEEINSTFLKGNNYEYYKSPKLLIKHNNIIPQALFTEEKVCFTSSIYSILFDEYEELKFLCAIINSSLIQFYCTYAINNQKDTTINLNQYMIRHLPIMKVEQKIKLKIVDLFDQIDCILKKTNGIVDRSLSKLIRDLDYLIFNLYSLNAQESNLIISKIGGQISFFNKIYECEFG